MDTVNTNSENVQPKTVKMQLIAWLLFYLFLLLYLQQRWDHPGFGFWGATVSTIFYAAAVYGNASLLIPRLYKRQKKGFYFICATAFLIALLLIRVGIEYTFLLSLHPALYGLSSYHFSFAFITNLVAFLFGALLRIAIDHIFLLRKQEEMKARQAATELALLKSQVQPHFLFNTLNNIYYLAYTKNENTAQVIARLSDIMRYFVDEAPKEKVPISTEISFLENYIELEQIRMLHRAKISFSISTPDASLLIPPMLLIPFVENLFKHGIDKTLPENIVHITLEQQNGHLIFHTENTFVKNNDKTTGGQGLTNLQKRLDLLFENNFEFNTTANGNCYKAFLKFAV